jgi:hypothetical protein
MTQLEQVVNVHVFKPASDQKKPEPAKVGSDQGTQRKAPVAW